MLSPKSLKSCGRQSKAQKLSSNLSVEHRALREKYALLVDPIARVRFGKDLPLATYYKAIEDLRKQVYENMNQSLHRHAALLAVKDLEARARRWPEVKDWRALTWFWHPEQTSHKGEADVFARDKRGRIVVQAEVTASAAPKGKVAERMDEKLKWLKRMQVKSRCRVFYYVTTDKMWARADRRAARLVTVVPINPRPAHLTRPAAETNS